MNHSKNLRFLSSLFFIGLLTGCSSNVPDIKWSDYTAKEVAGPAAEKTARIDLDVYLDATTSMQGFAVNTSSVYSQFLDQLEASALSAWKNADTKFYKFGEIIKPVERADFLSAKNDLAFYHEKGIFLKTYIDSVVKRTDSKRLSVLITDLFQDDGDVNTMVEKFKEKCFSNAVEVGIIGIKSEFKGKVFDVRGFPGGYDLDTKERPFYAIVFGNQANMSLLFEALKAKSFVKEDQFLIISPYIVKSFEATLTKAPPKAGETPSSISNKKARAEIKNSFDFGMQAAGKDGKMDLTIDISRNTRCADFSAKNIELIAFKKSATDPKMISKDSVTTSDITIENIQRTGNKLTATVLLKNEDGKGNYSYAVYLKANSLNGLLVPAWVSQFSSDNPVPGTPSAAKTYNFEKLCSTLLVANASVSPTYIAKFYINIFKR